MALNTNNTNSEVKSHNRIYPQ